MQSLRLSLVLIFTLLLGGCSLFGVEVPEPTEPELWEGATKALSEDNYEVAIDKLEQLESRFPFGRYSAQAQLELIYAYHKTGRSEETRGAADRFIRLHPQHDNVDYAYYLKGLSNFDEDADLIGRYVPTDSSQRDPGAARDSFNDFATLLNRHPQSQYAPDARLRMLYLRNQLAAYEVHVARYYISRGAFIAAANRGRYVVENYQQTPSVPDALAIMVRSYDELGLTDLAGDAQRVLDKNFPDYGNTAEEGRSLLNILSFGLLGKNEIDRTQPPATAGDAPPPTVLVAKNGSFVTTRQTKSEQGDVPTLAPFPVGAAETAMSTPVAAPPTNSDLKATAAVGSPVAPPLPSPSSEATAEEAVAKTPTPAPQNAEPASQWQIQLGSFRNPDNAKGLMKKLNDAGYPASLQQEGEWVKVLVGPQGSFSGAKAQHQKLSQQFQIDGMIVKQ